MSEQRVIFDPALADRLAACSNVAVAVVADPDRAVPMARALAAGGVKALELTFRTAAAAEAIRRIVSEVPEMLVSAGTILTIDQLWEAREAGAAFAVAPGFNPHIVQAAAEAGFSFAPGVMTPSEIEAAVEMGCTLLKIFPASLLGGPKGVKTLIAPYRHLGLRFLPLGGLTADNTGEYLSDPAICACGGSWIAPTKSVEAEDWDTIKSNAVRATALARTVRT